MSGLWKREMGLKYKFDNRPHVIPETLRSTQENRIMKADWGTPAQGIAKDTAYSTGRHFDHCFLLVLLYVYVDLFIGSCRLTCGYKKECRYFLCLPLGFHPKSLISHGLQSTCILQSTFPASQGPLSLPIL